MPPKTQHSSGGIDPAVVFPSTEDFIPRTQLPTVKSVIGVLQSLTAGGKAKVSHKAAVREVAKRIYAKWYHDTVFCLPEYGIVRKLEKLWKIFREGRKRYASGRREGKALNEYVCVVEQANQLFDVGVTTEAQSFQRKNDWGVSMSAAEYSYYEDQKTHCQMVCDKKVVWYCVPC